MDTLSLTQEEIEARREVARALGSIKTPRKSQASRENITRLNEQKKAQGVSEETKAKLREAQAARRERERQAKIERGELVEPVSTEKRKPGRPKKEIVEVSVASTGTEKKPVGRPRKVSSNPF